MSLNKFIEESQERMESIKVPNTANLLSEYAYGRCHIFALALHLELGFEMEYMWDLDYYFEDAPAGMQVLAHAYAVLPENHPHTGSFMDARGIITKDVILQDYEYNRESFERISPEHLEELFKSGYFERPTDEEVEALRAYIRKNISDYK